MVVFLVLLLVVRGLPALLVYRGVLPLARREQLVLITATTLPLLVALIEIGLASGTTLPEKAAALVGAGVLSVMLFPAATLAIAARQQPAAPP